MYEFHELYFETLNRHAFNISESLYEISHKKIKILGMLCKIPFNYSELL